MRKTVLILIFILIMTGLATPNAALAATYYVDKNHPSASDSNLGTETQPFLTINHAVNIVAPGDHVYVKGGTSRTDTAAIYNCNGNGMWIVTPGTAANPITVEVWPGDTVVLQSNNTGIGLYTDYAYYYTIKGFIFQNFSQAANGTSSLGDSTTQWNVTHPSGTTYRYTYAGTGTNPNITVSLPWIEVCISGAGTLNAANTGQFTVTNKGTGWFEVTNANGVVESGKTGPTNYMKTNLTLDSCEFGPMRTYGLMLAHIRNLTVTDCYAHINAEVGFRLWNCQTARLTRTRAEYCHGSSTTDTSCDGFGVDMTSDDIVFTDCTSAYNVDGFDLTGNCTLINCVSHDNYAVNVKMFRRISDLPTWRLNVYHLINCISYGAGENGYLTAEGAEAHFYNCLSYNNTEDGIKFFALSANHDTTPVHSTISNTIFCKNSNPVTVAGMSVNVVDADHNLYYANTNNNTTGLHSDFSSITDQDPLFVNPGAGLFQLQAGSPAIDKGTDLSSLGYNYDILNKSRPQGAGWDIGAYEYVSFLFGDVSGDAEVSAYDAALTAQASVELITLTADQTKAADVSGDGVVSAYDAALIAQKAVGLIDKFPVEG